MLITHAARQLRASSRGAPSAALRATLSARLITSTAPVRASLVDNPNLADLAGNDYLYHIGLNPSQQDLKTLFGDVRFVCLGGSVNRMAEFAETVADELGEHESISVPFGMRPSPIGKTDRYSMFKVGPVLISSHGMGQPSMSILLHEIAKLLHYAGADDPAFIRLGTSGGLGVKPGTVVVTTEGFNGMLGNTYDLPVNGKMVSRPSQMDADLVKDVLRAVETRPETSDLKHFKDVVAGGTMAADCFYEGQGRLDGAICDYEESDKLEFLQRAHDAGVRNIEMESLQFGAFAHRLGIRATACCVTLLNRLEGDQVSNFRLLRSFRSIRIYSFIIPPRFKVSWHYTDSLSLSLSRCFLLFVFPTVRYAPLSKSCRRWTRGPGEWLWRTSSRSSGSSLLPSPSTR